MASVTVNASEFASSSLQNNEDLYEARWQVWRAKPPVGDGVGHAALLIDTWYQDEDTTSYTFDPGSVRRVWVRVQYRDNYGYVGAWSDPLSSTIGTGPRRRAVVGPAVVLPEPGEVYRRDNEAQFRKTVEGALQDVQQLALQQGRQRQFKDLRTSEVLEDDADFQLPFGGVQRTGQISVSVVGENESEGGVWHFHGNSGLCEVTKLVGTTNTADTDTPSTLCVFTDGDEVFIGNRLGETVEVMVDARWL